MDSILLREAADKIRFSNRVVAFTGAGVSVESGIPAFRGVGGLWSNYDPNVLDIENLTDNPLECWITIKEIFYDHFAQAKPNLAHILIAKMEEAGYLQSIITQNIDHLHQEAGSKNIIEYHGTSRRLICTSCQQSIIFSEEILNIIPPRCQRCNSVLKPDFVFFGEAIPLDAASQALDETRLADAWLVIGSSGEVFPASSLPVEAKQNNKFIIEINTKPSSFTYSISDIFLQGKATEILQFLYAKLKQHE